MKTIPSICVYCGSSSGRDPSYVAEGRALGRAIAEAGWRLVYGGGQPDRGELEELASLPRASDRLVHDIRRKHPVT